MYGNSAMPPPPRSAGTVITLRVLFAAAGFLTCGLLACVPLFRVAVLRNRRIDWAAAWLSLPVSFICFAVVGSLPESDPRTDVALATVMLLGAAAAAYFVVTDIRLPGTAQPSAGYAPPYAQTVGASYDPARGTGPYVPAPAPQPPFGQPPFQGPPLQRPPFQQTPFQTPAPQTPVPQSPATQPPAPQRPAPARIDQVRAELDELSDYLRKQEDGR